VSRSLSPIKGYRSFPDHLFLLPLLLPRSKVTITERSDFVRSIQIPPVRLVQDAWYATRTATVLLIRRDGLVRWWERDIYVLSEQGEPTQGEELQLSPRYYEWQIEKET
jgi:uncharacterized protein with NRDE domain